MVWRMGGTLNGRSLLVILLCRNKQLEHYK
jgi:hypothetical protein